ncbi:MAG: hypothetical protein ACKOPS_17875 [Cyanobium sp.]
MPHTPVVAAYAILARTGRLSLFIDARKISAEVRAHLAIANAGQPAGNASFSVMTVSVDGLVRGVGVADGDGVILVSFPYPLLPAPTAAERAAGTTRFEWKVSVAVYCGQLSLPADGGLSRKIGNHPHG